MPTICRFIPVETARIAQLLEPYLAQPGPTSTAGPFVLSSQQLDHISKYINILLRWNARTNLTAVRQPEEIVCRHFGESLFTARYLFPRVVDQPASHLIDVGSGAGFPGLPIKLWVPWIRVTLIESNHKKVAFLREVIRALTLMNIDVFAGRGAEYRGTLADVVTLRAVEKFGNALPTATGLVAPGGRVALLIGESQGQTARDLSPSIQWNPAVNIPGSLRRILLIGTSHQSPQESDR